MRTHHLPQGTVATLILRERYTPVVPWHHLVSGPYSLLKELTASPRYPSRGGLKPAMPRTSGFL